LTESGEPVTDNQVASNLGIRIGSSCDVPKTFKELQEKRKDQSVEAAERRREERETVEQQASLIHDSPPTPSRITLIMQIAPGVDAAVWQRLKLGDPNSADWVTAIDILAARIHDR